MLNSLREWGERRLTRFFALETTQKHLEFRWVCTDNGSSALIPSYVFLQLTASLIPIKLIWCLSAAPVCICLLKGMTGRKKRKNADRECRKQTGNR